MIVVHVCGRHAVAMCLLCSAEKRKRYLCWRQWEQILGGVSWDKIGVDKMAWKEQNYNEKIQVEVSFVFSFYKIAHLLYCLKIKPVYHCLSWL